MSLGHPKQGHQTIIGKTGDVAFVSDDDPGDFPKYGAYQVFDFFRV
jgi:hypothetical protein